MRILGAQDSSLQESMLEYQKRMKKMVLEKVDRLNAKGWKE